MPYDLTWIAIYEDGSELAQYNEDGTENKYIDIDRRKLRRFNLLLPDGKIFYSLFIKPFQKLIFRRRTLVRMAVRSEEETREVIYLVGWQQRVDSPDGIKNITAINYIYPQRGIMELDDTRDNLELAPQEV